MSRPISPQVGAAQQSHSAEASVGRLGDRFRYLIALAGFLVTLMLGTLYAWGVFVPTLQEYFDASRAEVMLPFSVASIVFALGMIPAGRALDKRGPRLVVLLGGVLAGSGYLLSSWADSLPLLVLSYGAVAGAGIALGYSGAAIAGVRWFPDYKGTATGILVGGFGLGAMVFGPIGHWLVVQLGGWQPAFRVFGIAFGVVIVLFSLILRAPPPGWKPKGWDPTAANRIRAIENTGIDFSAGGAVRTVEFVGMWFQFMLLTAGGFAIITNMVPFARDHQGFSPQAAVWLVSLYSLLNFAGRLVLGPLSDRIGRLVTFIICGALMTFALAAIPLSLVFAAPWLLYLSVMLGGAAFGGCLALSPALTADIWGLKNLGVNYGLMFTAWGMGSVVGPFIAGRVYDTLGRYEPAFWLLCGFAILGALVVQLVVRPALRRRLQALL